MRINDYGEILEKCLVENEKLSTEELQDFLHDHSLNDKTSFLICQSMKLSVLEKIFHAKTVKEAWSILLQIYEGVHPVKRTRLKGLKRQFKLIKQGKDESFVIIFHK